MSAWADQVENEEATNGTLANVSDFPTLGEAAKQAPPKGKAKKGVKLGIGEFLSMPTGGKAEFADKSLQDKAILLSLPTAPRGGPREDGDGRPSGGLGGGFRDYGGDREGRGSRFQRDDRPPREEREPSRADSVDDWGSTRKFVPGGDGGGGGGFGGSRGFGGGFGGDRGGDRGDRGGDRPPREPRAPSAADMVDDWGSSRKYEPSGAPGPRGGGFGGDDRRGPDRRFDGPPPPSKADLEDSWGRGRDYKPAEPAPGGRGFSGGRDGPREVSADREERWGRRAAPAEPSSSSAQESSAASGPSERPRLKLAPRSVPVAAGEQASGTTTTTTTSGAGAAAGAAAAAIEERKSGSNPFGAARPREEVLKEKGVDPIKEALKLEHGEVIRDETPAEKELKAEVESLQKKLEELKTSIAEGEEAEEAKSQAVSEAAQQLDTKERALLKLQAEEDDRVRFARSSRPEGRPARREEGAGREREGPAAAPPPPQRKDRW